jgi:AI-2E family transporter
VIAFVMNYIPFIGPFIATLFPTLLAMTQFESWTAVLGLFICLNIIQFAIGSFIEPRVSGNVLSISPFAVLFAVLLWTFLWGMFGAFIGVPIALAILSFCNQLPSTRWIAELLVDPNRRTSRSASGPNYDTPCGRSLANFGFKMAMRQLCQGAEAVDDVHLTLPFASTPNLSPPPPN